MKLWMTQGGRTAFRPSWLKMIAIWKHTHTQLCTSLWINSHIPPSSEGEHLPLDIYWPRVNPFSAARTISLHFMSLTGNSRGTTGPVAFTFNDIFFSALWDFIYPLLVRMLLHLQVFRRTEMVKHLMCTANKACIRHKLVPPEQQKCKWAGQCTNSTSSSLQLYPVDWCSPLAVS